MLHGELFEHPRGPDKIERAADIALEIVLAPAGKDLALEFHLPYVLFCARLSFELRGHHAISFNTHRGRADNHDG